jgi:hypothetical protein
VLAGVRRRRVCDGWRRLDASRAEALFGELAVRYPYIRSFAPTVLRTLSFASPRAGNEVLEALEVLAGMNAEHRVDVPAAAPLEVVPRKWRRVVVRPEGVDRRAWEFCVLSEARGALRSGDLTVAGSRRFTPWDGNLNTAAAWEGRRSSWFAEAGLPASGQEFADRAVADLDAVCTEAALLSSGTACEPLRSNRSISDLSLPSPARRRRASDLPATGEHQPRR